MKTIAKYITCLRIIPTLSYWYHIYSKQQNHLQNRARISSIPIRYQDWYQNKLQHHSTVPHDWLNNSPLESVLHHVGAQWLFIKYYSVQTACPWSSQNNVNHIQAASFNNADWLNEWPAYLMKHWNNFPPLYASLNSERQKTIGTSRIWAKSGPLIIGFPSSSPSHDSKDLAWKSVILLIRELTLKGRWLLCVALQWLWRY